MHLFVLKLFDCCMYTFQCLFLADDLHDLCCAGRRHLLAGYCCTQRPASHNRSYSRAPLQKHLKLHTADRWYNPPVLPVQEVPPGELQGKSPLLFSFFCEQYMDTVIFRHVPQRNRSGPGYPEILRFCVFTMPAIFSRIVVFRQITSLIYGCAFS